MLREFVIACALATPVCAFARGALPELLDAGCGRLAEPGDVGGLAAAIDDAAGLSRAVARRHAVRHWSLERMVDGYVELYRALATAAVA